MQLGAELHALEKRCRREGMASQGKDLVMIPKPPSMRECQQAQSEGSLLSASDDGGKVVMPGGQGFPQLGACLHPCDRQVTKAKSIWEPQSL